MPSFESRKLAALVEALRVSGAPGFRNDPIAAVLWITLAMALFAALSAFAKQLGQAGLPPFETIFFRNLFGLVFMLPLLFWRGASLIRTEQFGLYGVRVALSLFSMMVWFHAVILIPLGELQAIGFTAPLFATLFAMFYLGEIVRARRWTALFVGFVGALVILRPGMAQLGYGQILALVAALVTGMIGPLIKQLTAKDDADKIVFLSALLMTPLSLIPALFVWQWPTAALWPHLAGMGLCAALGHVALVRGLAATDASLAFSFEFSRLPFAVAIGYWVFGESTDLWTWAGALVIFAAALYITRREAQLQRQGTGIGRQ
ncbi:MAG: DMT family transporter [Hyphomicrobiaceae bacterium]